MRPKTRSTPDMANLVTLHSSLHVYMGLNGSEGKLVCLNPSSRAVDLIYFVDLLLIGDMVEMSTRFWCPPEN